ncbi:MAG: hypothetical protein QNK92_01550 [Amylibacter sp.]
MTKAEQLDRETNLRKMDAEISKLLAETSRINAEMPAMAAKIAAETAKISNENRWYPAVVASGATLAIVAIVKIFL